MREEEAGPDHISRDDVDELFPVYGADLFRIPSEEEVAEQEPQEGFSSRKKEDG